MLGYHLVCPPWRMAYWLDLKVSLGESKTIVRKRETTENMEWETHRLTLERMKESKEKQYQQQSQEERDAVYAKMLHNLERTRAAISNSISKASTISDEKCQLTLTEDDFLVIKQKMDKINQRLDGLYIELASRI